MCIKFNVYKFPFYFAFFLFDSNIYAIFNYAVLSNCHYFFPCMCSDFLLFTITSHRIFGAKLMAGHREANMKVFDI